MHWINWLIVAVYLIYVVVDGLRRSRGTKEIEGYFLANRSLPWWAVGLSVMATQLSAVTMIGTTGQGATDGMRFVQFYFGLPIAMVILGVTLVPFLHGSRVFTAYEYLEKRFDAKTRSLTSFLFLISRGMSCGAIISAPAIVFSAIFGWDLLWSVALIGIPTVIYTMIGGVQAVTWADVKQMVLIVVALGLIVVVLLMKLPVSPDEALRVAGAAGRMQVFDFSFTFTETYTFWSGILGGTFLMLSYFGTDQSQVQRYLTARSVDEARSSLLMSAYWKIPLQALVLLVGVLVFVYYLFTTPPLLFNPAHEQRVRDTQPAALAELQTRYEAGFAVREAAAMQLAAASTPANAAAFRAGDSAVVAVRTEALALARAGGGQNHRCWRSRAVRAHPCVARRRAAARATRHRRSDPRSIGRHRRGRTDGAGGDAAGHRLAQRTDRGGLRAHRGVDGGGASGARRGLRRRTGRIDETNACPGPRCRCDARQRDAAMRGNATRAHRGRCLRRGWRRLVL
jgi:SSS family transporter